MALYKFDYYYYYYYYYYLGNVLGTLTRTGPKTVNLSKKNKQGPRPRTLTTSLQCAIESWLAR